MAANETTDQPQPPKGRIHGQTPRGRAQQRVGRLHEGRFARMFPDLPPAQPYPPERLARTAEQLRETDAPATPAAWGTPGAQPEGGDNPAVPAAYTYFGQFVDHDVTFDATSRLGTAADPDALTTFRSPRFDLDSLYGSGPVDEPFQYDQAAIPAGRLLLPPTQTGELDLPRNDQDTALIGDPRNDENTIVSQLQVAFIALHNRVLGELPGVAPEAAFDEARRIVRWHYQWVVVHDYLPRICDPALITALLEHDPAKGRPHFELPHYNPRRGLEPFIPVEFSAAAFRFGHTQVRAAYALNEQITNVPTFVPGDNVAPTDDLRGHKALPERWEINWDFFIDLGGGRAQPSRLIDGKLSAPLFDLPRFPAGELQSLAERNLVRGQDLALPSGQDVAGALGVAPLAGATLGTELDPTPLWLYVLLEANATTGGQRLGPVGGQIVAETLLGLLARDRSSYVRTQPTWAPNLPGTSGQDGTFGLADLLRHARPELLA